MDTRLAIPDFKEYEYELGPIRPPSEAFSLLIRVTRNCSWNRCQFCNVYRGKKFELRDADDVISDIKKAKAIKDGITELAWKAGMGSRVREIAAEVCNQAYSDSMRNVALWMYGGARSAFLQDANTLIMRTPDLVRVVAFLSQTFPELDRITSYARSKTAAKKTVDELRDLRVAGLSRLHIGMESGSELVLDYMDKGTTAEDHIKGGRNVKDAGIELSEYMMPGLGGKRLSAEHAAESARVLNAIDPDFIRFRTLQAHRGIDLLSRLESGDFQQLSEDEVVHELQDFIGKLEVTSMLKSDHMLNLLPELEGQFPEAKETCLAVIDRYLSMPVEERLNFVIGRRALYYELLDDMFDPAKRERVDEIIRRTGVTTPEEMEAVATQLKDRFI